MAVLTEQQMRALIAKHFRPEDVDKALYIARGESGYRTDAIGDNGASIGLFQLNDNGLGKGMSRQARLDPETNVRTAAQAVYGGSGWSPWGEGATYNGQPFGALGRHPYRGPSASPSGGIFGEVGGANMPGNVDEETAGNLRDQILQFIQAAINGAPDPKSEEFLADDGQGGTYFDNTRYKASLDKYETDLKNAVTLWGTFGKQAAGFTTLPDGTIIPNGDVTPDVRTAVDRNNARAAAKLFNDYALQDYNLARQYTGDQNDLEQVDFDNALSVVTKKLSLDQTNLEQSGQAIDRALTGLQESRARAQTIGDQTLKAAPYATAPGKTSFSGQDLGAIAMAYANMTGLGGGPLINYPTTVSVDPQGLMSQFDQMFGVGGSIPQPAQPITVPGDIPMRPPMGQSVAPPQITPPPQGYAQSTFNPFGSSPGAAMAPPDLIQPPSKVAIRTNRLLNAGRRGG